MCEFVTSSFSSHRNLPLDVVVIVCLVLPIGLGLSLINNALFLAHKINEEKTALTLIDVLAKRYGKTVEVLLSLVTITSFIMLLAGNLVGMGFVCSYVWGTSKEVGIWLAALIIWMYTVGGG
jgi:solute:Na+ symporter, SSS family